MDVDNVVMDVDDVAMVQLDVVMDALTGTKASSSSPAPLAHVRVTASGRV